MRAKNEEDKEFWENVLIFLSMAWGIAGLFVWAIFRI